MNGSPITISQREAQTINQFHEQINHKHILFVYFLREIVSLDLSLSGVFFLVISLIWYNAFFANHFCWDSYWWNRLCESPASTHVRCMQSFALIKHGIFLSTWSTGYPDGYALNANDILPIPLCDSTIGFGAWLSAYFGQQKFHCFFASLHFSLKCHHSTWCRINLSAIVRQPFKWGEEQKRTFAFFPHFFFWRRVTSDWISNMYANVCFGYTSLLLYLPLSSFLLCLTFFSIGQPNIV